MKNKLFVGSGVMLLSIFLACLLNLPVMWLSLKIVDLFVALEFFGKITVSLVVSVISVSGILGAIRYLVAYRSASFDVAGFTLSYVIATIFQLAVSLLLKFPTAIAGGTVYLAGIFEHGSYFSSLSDIDTIGLLDYLPAFLIISVIVYLVNLICGCVGKKKRIKDREDVLSYKNS